MTKITIKRNKNGHKIICDGHAYEAHGADGNLVCAAVSTIAQTIAYYLYNNSDKAQISDITIKDGFSRQTTRQIAKISKTVSKPS